MAQFEALETAMGNMPTSISQVASDTAAITPEIANVHTEMDSAEGRGAELEADAAVVEDKGVEAEAVVFPLGTEDNGGKVDADAVAVVSPDTEDTGAEVEADVAVLSVSPDTDSEDELVLFEALEVSTYIRPSFPCFS